MFMINQPSRFMMRDTTLARHASAMIPRCILTIVCLSGTALVLIGASTGLDASSSLDVAIALIALCQGLVIIAIGVSAWIVHSCMSRLTAHLYEQTQSASLFAQSDISFRYSDTPWTETKRVVWIHRVTLTSMPDGSQIPTEFDGYCHIGQGFRLFRVDRVIVARDTKSGFIIDDLPNWLARIEQTRRGPPHVLRDSP